MIVAVEKRKKNLRMNEIRVKLRRRCCVYIPVSCELIQSASRWCGLHLMCTNSTKDVVCGEGINHDNGLALFSNNRPSVFTVQCWADEAIV